MTEREMRELDAWVAEHGFGIQVEWENNVPIRKEPISHIWGAGMGLIFDNILRYSSADFSLVKREIERRGWRWSCTCNPFDKDYRFYIIGTSDGKLIQGDSIQNTEELAGCLAFKQAVEATDGNT